MTIAVVFSSTLDVDRGSGPSESFSGHESLLEAMALTADSRALISSGLDDTVRFWNLDPSGATWGEELTRLPHGSRPYALAPSTDGRYLAVGGSGNMAVWERKRDDWALLTSKEGTGYRYLAFAPGSWTLAIGGEGDGVRVIDVPSMKERRVLKGLDDAVHSVAFSPDGSVLAATSFAGELVMWDWRTGAVRPAVKGIGRVKCFAFTPDGRCFATAPWVEGGGITLRDLATGEVKARFGSREDFNSLAFSPDGSLLAASDHSIQLWDVRTGEIRGRLDQGGRWVKTILFTNGGSRLAYGGYDGAIHFWSFPGSPVDAPIGSRPSGARSHTGEG